MAQGTVAKLAEKEARRVTKKRVGSFTPLMARIKSTYHEKNIALKVHRELIEAGINQGPVFDGSGLPDEVVKVVKAKEEPRALKAGEWREGYVVRGFGRRGNKSGCILRSK